MSPSQLADVDLFSCQRSVARQTAGWDEPRAQELYGSAAGVSPQAEYPGEARVLNSIIQGGKKSIRSLMIVFIEIQRVMEFF